MSCCSILCRLSFARILFVVMVLIASLHVEAFSGRTSRSPRAPGKVATASTTTELSAWSLPIPGDLRSFTSMKSTWYDEINPTARRTVYNDRLLEDLTFSNLGTDWPSFLDEIDSLEVANEASSPPRRNRNPLRRVRGLASRLRRRA